MQIAPLVQLAFARMPAKAGTPGPAIPDHAIVCNDDDRIEQMFDALIRWALELKIVVISCRQKAFRDPVGRALALFPAAQSRGARQTGQAGMSRTRGLRSRSRFACGPGRRRWAMASGSSSPPKDLCSDIRQFRAVGDQ